MVVDKNFINELAGKLADAVPGDLNELRNDIRNNFRSLLQNRLDKLDLVTREEFDVQRKVLERTREKLDRLETELEELQRDTIGTPEADGKVDINDQQNSKG
ncbi:MAG: accessory factor UbiK family protein [Gammaproteobacteria bacterium]|nr:MAG: accessory factor UbiK family protein [Gammaproteobacteria bacterium]